MRNRLVGSAAVALGLILAPEAARFVYAACETILATDSSKVAKSGDEMTGNLLMTNVPVKLTGASGYVSSQSSITAQAFFGDGANLTALNATQLTSGTIPQARIGTEAIDTDKLKNGAITRSKVMTAAIDTTKLESGAVGQSQLQDSSITTSKIVASAVDTTKLGSGAVGQSQLQNTSITTDKLVDGAVDTAKLGGAAVTSGKILSGAVDTAKLATDAVTNTKILDAAVDTRKITATGVAAGTYSTPSSISLDLSGRVTAITAGSGGTGTVVVSTSQPDLSVTTTNTAYGVCVATLTINTTACTATDIILGIDATDDTNNRLAGAVVLVNGAYISPYSSTAGMASIRSDSAVLVPSHPLWKTITLNGLDCSGGTLNFCLSLKVAAGTLTVPPSATSDGRASWGVRVYK